MTYEQWTEHIINEIKKENSGRSVDFLIPKTVSKKIEGYTSMALDLETCHETILALSKVPYHNAIISSALFHAFVVLYGKCFTENKVQYPKLNPKDCFKDKHSGFNIIHDKLMFLRNNFVAHHGNTNNEYIFPYLKISIDGYDVRVGVWQTKKMAYTPKALKDYLAITIHLRQIVELQKQKCTNKIINHMQKTYDWDELSKFKIAGPDIPFK